MADKTASDLFRGSIELMVLSTLAEEARYGYLIQQQLAAATAGALELKAGTLYPILHRLESQGLARSKTDRTTGRQRKWYTLTAAGRRQLTQQATSWSEYAASLADLLKPVLQPSPKPAT